MTIDKSNPTVFEVEDGRLFVDHLRRSWIEAGRPSRLTIPTQMVEVFTTALFRACCPFTTLSLHSDSPDFIGTCYLDADLARNVMGLGLVVYADDAAVNPLTFSNGVDETSTCTFGEALAALKKGRRIARRGWNGKDMWLVLIRAGNAIFRSDAGAFDMQDCIGMKTAQGQMQPGWLARQADLLSDDWVVL